MPVSIGIEWLKIFGIAFNLINTAGLNFSFTIETRWENLDKFYMHSPVYDTALVIDIINNNDQKLLTSLVLTPWQDIYLKRSETDDLVIPTLTLFTVTQHVLVFENSCNNLSLDRNEVPDIIKRMLDYDNNQLHIDSTLNIPENYKIISKSVFPNYIILQIAEPGSGPVHPSDIADLLRNKMIELSIIPDRGYITKSWIKGKTGDLFPETETAVQKIINSSLEKCLLAPDKDNRQIIFEKALINIQTEINELNGDKPNICNHYKELLTGLLFLDYPKIGNIEYDNIFGDYQPKITPDKSVDFMPEISGNITTIPESNPENLVKLIVLFSESKKNAVKNKGKWIEGNLILGARAKEYKPSKEELVLDEIGERIRYICEKYNLNEIKKILKENGVWRKNIRYSHFTFIHYDVMGSGRFFYVNKIEERRVKINQNNQFKVNN